MTRKAYDSTTAADTPMDGDLYLGYVDGNFANVAALQSRHPGKLVVGITVNGSNAAQAKTADIEAGDMGAAAGARLAKTHLRQTGEPFTLYFPASLRRTVATECRKIGLKPGRDVLFFPADYDGKAKIPRWAIGKQYLHGDKGHPGAYSGGHFDVSVVRDYWPGVDPKPKPAATTLSGRSTYLASHLVVRLTKRQNPVSTGKTLLTRLRNEIDRILAL